MAKDEHCERTASTIRSNAQETLAWIRRLNEEAAVRERVKKLVRAAKPAR